MKRTATRKYIECGCCELLLWKWRKKADWRKVRIGGRKTARVCAGATIVRGRKKEGRGRKRRKT